MENICFDRTTFYIGIALILFVVYFYFNKAEKQCNVAIMDRIIHSTKELDKIVSNKAIIQQENKVRDLVAERDKAVISNPLYPPLGRTERPVFDDVNANFNIQTRGSEDTYRLLGYLVNKTSEDLGSNVWQLFGRQKYRGSSMGEFYVVPSHKDKQHMKIQLKDDMFTGEKIRDIYALPKTVQINSPFFSQDSYELVELQKTDFTSQYI